MKPRKPQYAKGRPLPEMRAKPTIYHVSAKDMWSPTVGKVTLVKANGDAAQAAGGAL